MDQERSRTRLAEVMAYRHLTREQLAARSGLSRPTVSLAAAGRAVSFDTWVRLAETLGVSVAEIAPADVAARISSVA